MGSKVRRIVTGHDGRGRAVFAVDEIIEEEMLGAVVWSTDQLPADNNGPAESAGSPAGIAGSGAVVRVMTIEPGHRSPMHRTQTLDFGVVIEGAIDLELDDGAVRTVRPGDVVVQRGTIHAWCNNTDQPCRIAFILMPAQPLTIGGARVEPTHA